MVKKLLVLAVLFCAITTSASFGEYKLQSKLTYPEPVTKCYFGYSVDIDGDIAIVGAKHYNSSGVAYIYEYNGLEWSSVAKLSAPDSTGTDNFGISVAISGSVAVVDSIDYDSNGVTFVYEFNDNVWELTGTIKANDAEYGDDFGCSVDVDGGTIVVGARYKDNNKGAAYVFEKSGSVWVQQQKLIASDGKNNTVHLDGDQLGCSVSISGERIVVGGQYVYLTAKRMGATYVFEKSGGSWQQNESAKLTASDGHESDFFGNSVSVSGDTIAVGAYYFIGNLISGDDKKNGKVYIYDYSETTNQWDEDSIVDPTPNQSAYFGKSVSLDDENKLLVGAYWDKNDGVNTGTSYLFTRLNGQWDTGVEYVASDLIASDFFGWSVAIDGNNLLVGAYAKDQDSSGDEKGAAYFYQYTPYSSDITADQQVDIADLAIMAGQWLDTPGLFSADIAPEPNGDGIVNLLDFALLSEQWLNGATHRITNLVVGECNRGDQTVAQATDENISTEEPLNSYTIAVDESYIDIDGFFWENCCVANLHFDLIVDSQIIKVYIRENNNGSYCTCICQYPMSATFGPFDSGEYLFEIYDVGGGLIGQQAITIP